jgi:hypothetical protein
VTAIELMTDKSTWTSRTAATSFPILMRRAIDGLPITYGGLKKLAEPWIPGPYALHYRTAAGRIGDICLLLADEMGEAVPPLNAIIVNGTTGLPSDGVDWYLGQFLGLTKKRINDLNDEDRDNYAREAINKVLVYDGWNRVRKHLGLILPRAPKATPRKRRNIPPPDHKKFATGPESMAHKALKTWVKAHPETFQDYGKFGAGETEETLSSGDRLDVYFANSKTRLAVEVKAKDASDAEVSRGVYQCIKYRATVRAMQLAADKPPNAQAILVLDRDPPSAVAKLADLLSVTILNIGPLINRACQSRRRLHGRSGHHESPVVRNP